MNLNLNLFVNVKLRAFGFTFGRVERGFVISFDPATGKLLFGAQPLVPPPSAYLLVNERGVLVSAWV